MLKKILESVIGYGSTVSPKYNYRDLVNINHHPNIPNLSLHCACESGSVQCVYVSMCSTNEVKSEHRSNLAWSGANGVSQRIKSIWEM